MSDLIAKPRKTVFVVMPFVESPTRNEPQLTSFFENNVKAPIEKAANLDFSYSVRRSDVTLDITTQIIRDLLRADIVIADLSGKTPNPNVMYELGVRLAVSAKPVILVREKHSENRRVFDVNTFFTFEYDPFLIRIHTASVRRTRVETGRARASTTVPRAHRDGMHIGRLPVKATAS